MSLSSDLVSQFVKATNDTKTTKGETTVYGTVVYDGKLYVKLDGSDLLTPVTTTTDVQDGERVTVQIKNHTATITGNVSSPAARTEDVQKANGKITEFENIMAYSVTAENAEFANATIDSLYAKIVALEQANVGDLSVVKADIEKLKVNFVDGKNVSAKELNAINAEIEHIEAQIGEFKTVYTGDFTAIDADIETLRSYTADFVYVSAEVLKAVRGEIKILDANKIGADQAEFTYANIDFTNITEAAMQNFYANSGLIDNVIVGDGKVTGNLVGVTIRGDQIVGETIVADNLIIKGENGLYYRLNEEAGVINLEHQETAFFRVNSSVTYRVNKVPVFYRVNHPADTDIYDITNEIIEERDTTDALINGVLTDEGDQVYKGTNEEAEELYFCIRYIYTKTDEVLNRTPENPLNGIFTIDNDQVYYEVISDTESVETLYFCVRQEYTATEEVLVNISNGVIVDGAIADNGEQVYSGITDQEETVYYCTKLVDPSWYGNQLHGTAIVAKSITADQISVSDLVAFGASIGGFQITNNAIHSHGKNSATSGVRGVYQDNDGQFAIGDSNSYLRIYKNENGEYKLEISADSILFAPDSNSSLKELAESDHVKIGTSKIGEPSIELSDDDTSAKQTITSTKTTYSVGDDVGTEIDTYSVTTDTLNVNKEIIQAGWAWVEHNGNLGLVWRG